MEHLQLSPQHLHTLQMLLAQHVPQAEVWSYSSRVTGGAHKGSDLNLVLRNPADLTQEPDGWLDLKDALQQSSLPLLVDVHLWVHLPESSQRHINARYMVLQ